MIKMKRNSYSMVIFSLVVISVFFWGIPTIVQAENVQTNGEIIIEKDETMQTTTSSKVDSPKVKKPIGRLPSTGDLVKTSLSISGIALLIVIFVSYLWKRKKSAAQKGEE
ncbi:cell wall protein [Enterococcus plantarum]|uniref:Cell wall protein n=2 Tax=Enterococcus TaxID=1350 RepID=A0A2W4BHZ9_9ENTE|nr:cell wall protein [Enterococcus plantarum]